MKYSKEFLTQLDLQHNRTVYAKITALTMDERPMETVEGKATSGSINLDGSSAVRRTCSLSLVTNNINISNYLWSLNTKFKLEIGLHNYSDNTYPEIIWFNQGIYLITSFNTALSANSFTINIQGKDKMCRLNGENGGMFQSSVDFGKMEEIDAKGNRTFIQQQLKDIIREMVHAWGGEPYENIVINDLETTGLMLEEYIGENPLFLVRKSTDAIGNKIANIGEYQYAYTNGHEVSCRYWGEYTETNTNGEEVQKEGYIVGALNNLPVYESLIKTLKSPYEIPTEFQFVSSIGDQNIIPGPDGSSDSWWTAVKIENGQTAGYSETELTYAGDLVANAGETITSVLDKIKNMLGDFEYFYNLDGQFVFQRNKNYINVAWTPDIIWKQETDENGSLISDYAVEPFADASSTIYSFLGNELLVSFNNTPNLQNLKNDYSVWGNRTSANGGTVPIHLRYAIDKKPTKYTTIYVPDADLIAYNNKFGLNATGQNSVTYVAYEPTTFNYVDDIKKLIINSSIVDGYENKNDNIPDGAIQINMNYDEPNDGIVVLDNYTPIIDSTVVQCDWRELIYRMALDYRKYGHLDDFQLKVADANPDEYPTGMTGYEQYYVDMEGFWRQLYSTEDVYTEIPFSLFVNYYNNKISLEELAKFESTLANLENKMPLLTKEELEKYSIMLAEEPKKINEKQRLIAQQEENLNILNRAKKLNITYNEVLDNTFLNGEKVYYLNNNNDSIKPYYEQAKLKDEDIYISQNDIPLERNQLFIQTQTYEDKNSYQTDLYMFEGNNFDNWYNIKLFGTKSDVQNSNEKYYTIKAMPNQSISGYTIKTATGFNFDPNNPINEIYQIEYVTNANNLSFEIKQITDLNEIDNNTLLFTKKEVKFYDLIPLGEYNGQAQQPYYSLTYLKDKKEIYSNQDYYVHGNNYVITKPKKDISNEDIFCEATYNIIRDSEQNPITAQCAQNINIDLIELNNKITNVQNTIKELLTTHFQDELRDTRKGLFKLDKLALNDLLIIAKILVLLHKNSNIVLHETFESKEPQEPTSENLISESEPLLSENQKNDLKSFIEQYLENMNTFIKEYDETFEELYNIKHKSFMSINKFCSTYDILNATLKNRINSKLKSLWMPKEITYDTTGVKENNEQVSAAEYFFGLVVYYYENFYDSCGTRLSNIDIDMALQENGWGSHSLISFVKRMINKINNQKAYLEELKDYVNNNSFIPKPYYKKINNYDDYSANEIFYLTEEKLYYKDNNFDETGPWKGWNRQVYQSPEKLNFWFDFLDSSGAIESFSARAIGVRPIVKNDNDTKSIYQKSVPLVIYHDNQNTRNHTSYAYIDINEIVMPEVESLKNKYEIIKSDDDESLIAIEKNNPQNKMPLDSIEEGIILLSSSKLEDPNDGNFYTAWRYSSWNVLGIKKYGWRGFNYNLKNELFTTSAQGKTAKNVLDELLYQHSYCTESVSISAVPVYHLEPNTRIYVFDANTGIEGEYLLNKITIPLSYNGQMTMQATKAVSRLL